MGHTSISHTSEVIVSDSIVTIASAYIMLGRIVPWTDDLVAAKNLTPETAGRIMLLSRLVAGLISASAGGTAAWVASRFQKK